MIYTPDMNDGRHIFVFGSNLAGIHGAGAAKDARLHWGAESKVCVGRTGMAYAIPTKDAGLRTIPITRILPYVEDFKAHAARHPNLTFLVTRIGCGLAGYSDSEIAPFFKGTSKNCVLPKEWNPLIKSNDLQADKDAVVAIRAPSSNSASL